MPARFATAFAVIVALACASIAQEARPEKTRTLRQVVHPVGDLIVPIDMDHTKASRDSATLENQLMDLVRRTCEPKSWNGAGGQGTIQYHPLGMAMVVNQSTACQERIAELFAELRKLQDIQISIEARYLTLSVAKARQLEVLGDRTPQGKFLPADGPDAVCLSNREVLLLLAGVQEDDATTIMTAPKVTIFNGQKCALTVLDQIGVKDGDVDQDGKALTGPNVEVGIRNVLQAVVEPTDGSVRLAVECRQAEQQKATAQRRVFATHKIQHVVRVPASQTVAMKLGAGAKGAQHYVLLTPRVLCSSEQEVARVEPPAAAAPARPENVGLQLFIRPPAPKRASQELRVRVVPIADLLAPIVAVPNANQETARRTAGASVDMPLTASALIELVTATAAPSRWEGKGGDGVIAYYPLGQALVVLQREEVHEEVANLLTALRRLYDLRVSLDCRIVEMSEAAAERIARSMSRPVEAVRGVPRLIDAEEQDRTGPMYEVPPVNPALPALPKAQVRGGPLLLTAREARQLRSLIADEGTSVAEHALGAVGFNGSRMIIDKTKPYTYTSNVHVKVENGQIVVQPETRTLRVGTLIVARPVVNADREGLKLEITVEHSNLGAGSATQVVRVGTAGEEKAYEIQSPISDVFKLTTTVQVAKNGTLVFPLGAFMSETRNEFGPPVLSKIPYLNRLFTNVGYGREARQLYVVITPQIHSR